MYKVALEKSLEYLKPNVAKQWHPTKNNGLTPKDFTSESNKIAWWQCLICDHEWSAQINKRGKAAECPNCKIRCIEYKDSLKYINPELSKSWHDQLNGKLTPEHVKPLSNRKIWWQCDKEKDHVWYATIAKRHGDGRGCPFCSNHKVHKNNSLLNIRPDVAKQWHPTKNAELTPKDVSVGSQQLVWWLCETCRNSWESSIKNRTAGNGCPYCSNRKTYEGNRLETLRPDIALEWHPIKNGDLTPHDVTCGTNKKFWWLCNDCGHEWRTAVYLRTIPFGTGCPKCSSENHTSLPEQIVYFYFKSIFENTENRYQVVFEGKKIEADVFLPKLKIAIEYDGLLHKGKEEQDEGKNSKFHQLNIKLFRIRQEGLANLKEHGSVMLIHKENDFASLKECMVKIGDYIIENYKLNADTIEKIKELKNIDIEKDTDLIYSSYATNKKKRSIAYQYPELLEEWDYDKNILTPDKYSTGSNRKVHWVCKKCNYKWTAVVASRCDGKNCPRCNNQVADETNSVGVTNPELLEEWVYEKNSPITPFNILPGSDKYITFKCKKCHLEWTTRLKERTGTGGHKTGCPYCANKKLSINNCLSTRSPERSKYWHPTKNANLTPRDVIFSSWKKVWWQCIKCNHEWEEKIRQRDGKDKISCPECRRKNR